MEFLVDAEAPYLEHTRTELSTPVKLLAAVIALAADDCRRIVHMPAYQAPTRRELIEGTSAILFFHSPEGQGMIQACGLGGTGVRAGLSLANGALRRLGLTMDDLSDSPLEWRRTVDRLDATYAKQFARAVVGRQEKLAFDCVA